MKKSFITGITGQDGYYLTKLLLNKGYTVHGISRPQSTQAKDFDLNAEVHTMDVTDTDKLEALIAKIKPDEFYHLATLHEVGFSKEDYSQTRKVDGDSLFYILTALDKYSPKCRLFYASSSNIFGQPESSPQNEETVYRPQSLYGICKTTNMHLLRTWREKKNFFACAGILFNHESPRRNAFFVSRKIALAAAQIKLGLVTELTLGNIEAQRDWGAAEDFVQAMWLMLQAPTAQDYVIGTGQLRSVKELLDIAFKAVSLDWRAYVKQEDKLVRPIEKVPVVADISKIKSELSWQPKVSFEELITQMVKSDLERLK